MISTNIGAVTLTDNQIKNWVPQGVWERFSFIGGEVIGVSETEPTQNDIDSFKVQLASLPDTEVHDWVKEFSVEVFQSGLFSILGSLSNINLRLEFGALNTFATNKDFTGIKQYLGFLITNSIATTGDYDAVNEVTKYQHIDLEDF